MRVVGVKLEEVKLKQRLSLMPCVSLKQEAVKYLRTDLSVLHETNGRVGENWRREREERRERERYPRGKNAQQDGGQKTIKIIAAVI